MDCQTVERENIAERYLAGTLEPELKEQWELHYFGCDRCAQQLATWQSIHQPLRSMASSIRQEIQPRKPDTAWWAPAAVAAVLVLGFGIAILATRKPNEPKLQQPGTVSTAPPTAAWVELARLDPPAYQPPTLRSADSPAEVQFQKAMAFYLVRDYRQAIEGLQSAIRLDGDAAGPHFFLGACEFLTGKAAEASRQWELVANGDSPFAQEAQFDLAKAYLAQGNQQLALATLKRLSAAPGEFQEAARRLTERILASQ